MFSEVCRPDKRGLVYVARAGHWWVAANLRLHLRGKATKWVVIHYKERFVESVFTDRNEAVARAQELRAEERAAVVHGL